MPIRVYTNVAKQSTAKLKGARLQKHGTYNGRWGASGDVFLRHWAGLYTKPTESEAAIEPAIAALGTPYRVQHPIFAVHSIVDFALLKEKIIIEVDGKSHNSAAAKEADRARTLKIEQFGWVVVRCRNEDAQREPEATVQALLIEARARREAIATLTPKNLKVKS
jgi:very-short-patch-repair endonuclease